MGTCRGRAKSGVKPQVIAFELAQSSLLTAGKGGAHRVEDIGLGFYPRFLDQSVSSDIPTVDQENGFATCRRIAKEERGFCDGSTGLNVAGAVELAEEMDPEQRIVTLASDSGLKYLGAISTPYKGVAPQGQSTPSDHLIVGVGKAVARMSDL